VAAEAGMGCWVANARRGAGGAGIFAEFSAAQLRSANGRVVVGDQPSAKKRSAISCQLSAKAFCREEAQKAQDGLRLLCLFAAKVVWLIADG